MVRYHPQWLRAREIVRKGRIGDAARDPDVLRLLQSRSRQYPQQGGYRRRRALRHRLLRDRRRALFLRRGAACARSRSSIAIRRFGTDRLTSALVDFGGGRQLTFTVLDADRAAISGVQILRHARDGSRSRSPSTPRRMCPRGSSSTKEPRTPTAPPVPSSFRRSISTSCRERLSAARSGRRRPSFTAWRMR